MSAFVSFSVIHLDRIGADIGTRFLSACVSQLIASTAIATPMACNSSGPGMPSDKTVNGIKATLAPMR